MSEWRDTTLGEFVALQRGHDLTEQKAIAAVLGALDDKIEADRRMNATLEAMARALFQSWFVDTTQTSLPKGSRTAPFSETIDFFGGGRRKHPLPNTPP